VQRYVPVGADGQVHRVAQRFALIATGGELAVAAGVLPWSPGEAFAAAARCFTDWLNARGGIEPAEVRDGIDQVRSFVDDAARFLDDWGRKAAAVGWSALDVFGVSMQPPRIRSEMAGLLPFIAGGTVVAINSSSATIRSPTGDEVVWLRRSHQRAVAVWELG
jgi:hypothetical protein